MKYLIFIMALSSAMAGTSFNNMDSEIRNMSLAARGYGQIDGQIGHGAEDCPIQRAIKNTIETYNGVVDDDRSGSAL